VCSDERHEGARSDNNPDKQGNALREVAPSWISNFLRG
jgi:hypothetical protein